MSSWIALPNFFNCCLVFRIMNMLFLFTLDLYDWTYRLLAVSLLLPTVLQLMYFCKFLCSSEAFITLLVCFVSTPRQLQSVYKEIMPRSPPKRLYQFQVSDVYLDDRKVCLMAKDMFPFSVSLPLRNQQDPAFFLVSSSPQILGCRNYSFLSPRNLEPCDLKMQSDLQSNQCCC